jgi:hypothetical protein
MPVKSDGIVRSGPSRSGTIFAVDRSALPPFADRSGQTRAIGEALIPRPLSQAQVLLQDRKKISRTHREECRRRTSRNPIRQLICPYIIYEHVVHSYRLSV